MRLRSHAGFRLSRTASTGSDVRAQVTGRAIQVLIVTAPAGSAADVGPVDAARWLAYLLFGIVVGALADRVRRKPLLAGSDLTRAVLLCAVQARMNATIRSPNRTAVVIGAPLGGLPAVSAGSRPGLGRGGARGRSGRGGVAGVPVSAGPLPVGTGQS